MANSFNDDVSRPDPYPMLSPISSALSGGSIYTNLDGQYNKAAETSSFSSLFNQCFDSSSACGVGMTVGKGVLGGLTALGGAAACTSGIGCAFGAPSIIIGLSNVYEAADLLANYGVKNEGLNPIKQTLINRGLSSQTANTMMSLGEVAGAGLLLKAPVKVFQGEKYIDMLPNQGGFSVVDTSIYRPLWKTRGAYSEAAGAVKDAWTPVFQGN